MCREILSNSRINNNNPKNDMELPVLILISLKPTYESGQGYTEEASLYTSQDQAGLMLSYLLLASLWTLEAPHTDS